MITRFLPPLAALLALTTRLSAAYLIFPEGDPVDLRGETKSAHEAYKKGNLNEALRLFKAEATKGDKDAQFAMGRLYEEGKAVDASVALAESWYRKAALQGHPSAELNLAIILLNTPGQTAEGAEWLRKSAESGSPPRDAEPGHPFSHWHRRAEEHHRRKEVAGKSRRGRGIRGL